MIKPLFVLKKQESLLELYVQWIFKASAIAIEAQQAAFNVKRWIIKLAGITTK